MHMTVGVDSYSFPSGHTTRATTLTLLLPVLFPVAPPVVSALTLWCALVGISRVMLGESWCGASCMLPLRQVHNLSPTVLCRAVHSPQLLLFPHTHTHTLSLTLSHTLSHSLTLSHTLSHTHTHTLSLSRPGHNQAATTCWMLRLALSLALLMPWLHRSSCRRLLRRARGSTAQVRRLRLVAHFPCLCRMLCRACLLGSVRTCLVCPLHLL